MLRLSLTLFVICSSLAVHAGNQFLLPENFGEQKAIKIFQSGKNVLLVSNTGIWQITGDEVKQLTRTDANVTDAVVYNNELLLATSKGLLSYSYPDCNKLTATYFENEPVSCVSVDALNRLWAGCSYKGAYMKTPDSFTLKVNIPSVMSLVCTPDSNVWVGTNIGLYQIDAKTFVSHRYAEEGYSGYELPDNIVERLFTDESSNVWVMMPDNISFKRGKNYEGEIPSYGFLESKGNEIYCITPVKNGYLFSARQGNYYIPNASIGTSHSHGTSEVHTGEEAYAYKIDAASLRFPEQNKNATIRYTQKIGKDVYFLTDNIGWKVKEKQLIRK